MFSYMVDEEVSLKLLEKGNASEMYKLVDGSRVSLREWLPWVDSMTSAEEYVPIFQDWRKQFAENNGFQVGIIYKGNLAGVIGFHGIDWNNRKTTIGYWLGDSYQGNGIMTRACQALVDLAFHHYGLNRVEIQCGIKNEKSRAIPERLGFEEEGVIRDAEFLYDHFHDCVVYGMLARDWSR